MRLLKVCGVASAISLFIGGVSLGADYGMGEPPMLQAASPAMEWGSGWYLRGSVNVASDVSPQLSADVALKNKRITYGAELGAGYQFNNWFRMDLTGQFGGASKFSGMGARVTCPYVLTGLTTQAQNPDVQLGYLWDTNRETCDPRQAGTLNRTTFLLNGYFDLGTWRGVTPYVGAGVGVANLSSRTTLDYLKTSDGSVYQADLSPTGTFPHIWVDVMGNPINPQPTVAFAQQRWSQDVKRNTVNFAWALMAGFAVDLSEQAKLDIGYRYLNMGTYRSLASPITGATVSSKLSAQEVRVGLRYQID